jgi:thiol-disulfide isomerase/thioredoxin
VLLICWEQRQKMISRFKRVGCLVVLLLGGCSEPQGYALLDGGRIDLLTEDSLVFVNYWAVWCAPCIVEMPELYEFSEEHATQVRVLGVNYDGPDAETLRRDADTLGVQIELLVEDPQFDLGYARPEVLPTTVILRQGELLETLVGPQTIQSLEERLDWWTNN